MPLVRYVALAALVVWLGATLQAAGGDLMRHVHALAFACGGVMLVGLLIMKLVGPPPRAFFIRLTLVVVMLAISTLSGVRGQSQPAMLATAALGGILLAWYARE